MNTGATLIGLVRDAVAAVLGLAILFGAHWSDAQVGGMLLVVSTFGALGTWLYAQWRQRSSPEPASGGEHAA